MSRLIFDIETAGENWEDLDNTTQNCLIKRLERSSPENNTDQIVEEIKNSLGLSPLTGEIIVIGILDSEKEKGAVYYQAPDMDLKDFEEDGIKFRQMSEVQMLNEFWRIADSYDEFISFNGRGFDVPYLMVRSALKGIKPSKDLMSNRYLNSQKYNAKHIDLYDQLSFYGSSRGPGGLHMYCRAFNISSPKNDGIDGSEVGKYYKDEKYEEIARYNASDIVATNKLYKIWDKFLRFS
jgi:uncharacterized protein YprB with RNaseH-like and TPR domain